MARMAAGPVSLMQPSAQSAAKLEAKSEPPAILKPGSTPTRNSGAINILEAIGILTPTPAFHAHSLSVNCIAPNVSLWWSSPTPPMI